MKVFEIRSNLKIELPAELINDTIKDMVNGYLYRAIKVDYIPANGSYIKIEDGEEVNFSGEGESLSTITEKGVYISGINNKALLEGLFETLYSIDAVCLEEGKELITLNVGEIRLCPSIKRRMIHYCIFPKTPITTLKKLIRLSAVLGYTDVVLEFWGMLKYDCLKELSWEGLAYTKEQAKELVKEIKDLQMGAIPMFNHFGHASGCRVAYGKHVVLDQNPRLATLFTKDGWQWNFENQRVISLLDDIRKELYEVFGQGEFFHLGFDESFSYSATKEATEKLCGFIKLLCERVVAEGRVPLLWGDMFLNEGAVGVTLKEGYDINCPSKEISDIMLENLPKQAILCDWQYFVKTEAWKTTAYLKAKGKDVIVCPWTDVDGFKTAVETAKLHDVKGFMTTTWNKVYDTSLLYGLFEGYTMIYGIERRHGKAQNNLWKAEVMRKISFAEGVYEKAGWRINDVSMIFSL